MIGTAGTCFEICWVKKENVGSLFFINIWGKILVVTFIRPIRKIGT